MLHQTLRHLVALYVLYHLTSMVVGSIPATSGVMRRSYWRDATVQDEFAAWSARLTRVGLTIPPAELQEKAWRLSGWWGRMRERAMTPFGRYQNLTGTYQPWRMFVAPHRYPTRLRIEARRADGGWVDIDVLGPTGQPGRRALLRDVRVRSMLFNHYWGTNAGDFRRLATWLAKRARADHPEARAVRVRTVQHRSPTPAEARDGHASPVETARTIAEIGGDP